jgi:serine O-acetyltransferase
MLDVIVEDIRRKSLWYYGRTDKHTMLRMLVTDGTWGVIVFRICQLLRKLHLAPVAMLLGKINELVNGMVIGRKASFGPGFVILHTVGVVINGGVVGGKNVILEHGVTIGAEKGKSPVLGSDIFIGAGAKVIGGVKVGNNVKIGANAVVVKDVPDNVTVVGIPAKIVRTSGS